MPRVWTSGDDERLRVLHGQGWTLGQCAAELGFGRSTVSRKAAALGLAWDRAGTAAATAARRTDNRARRAELSSKLLAKAHDLLDQIDAPHLVYSFGGKDNTYNEHQLTKPPTGDIRNLMVAAGIAVQRHADLERVDADTGAQAASNLLTELGRALGVGSHDGDA